MRSPPPSFLPQKSPFLTVVNQRLLMKSGRMAELTVATRGESGKSRDIETSPAGAPRRPDDPSSGARPRKRSTPVPRSCALPPLICNCANLLCAVICGGMPESRIGNRRERDVQSTDYSGRSVLLGGRFGQEFQYKCKAGRLALRLSQSIRLTHVPHPPSV